MLFDKSKIVQNNQSSKNKDSTWTGQDLVLLLFWSQPQALQLDQIDHVGQRSPQISLSEAGPSHVWKNFTRKQFFFYFKKIYLGRTLSISNFNELIISTRTSWPLSPITVSSPFGNRELVFTSTIVGFLSLNYAITNWSALFEWKKTLLKSKLQKSFLKIFSPFLHSALYDSVPVSQLPVHWPVPTQLFQTQVSVGHVTAVESQSSWPVAGVAQVLILLPSEISDTFLGCPVYNSRS